MKKELTLLKRLKIALALVFKCDEDTLVEQCENCGSVFIARTYASPVTETEEGRKEYIAKYMCKKCGHTAIVQELWEGENK